MLVARIPGALPLAPIWPYERPLPMLLVLKVLTVILPTVWELEYALAIHQALLPEALV